MDRKEKMIELRQLGLSYQDIASLFGVSRQRVHQITTGYQQLEVSLRDGTWYRKIHDAIIERDKYKCQKCDSEENLIVHHFDADDKNNQFGNLLTLCSSCHLSLHRPDGMKVKRSLVSGKFLKKGI